MRFGAKVNWWWPNRTVISWLSLNNIGYFSKCVIREMCLNYDILGKKRIANHELNSKRIHVHKRSLRLSWAASLQQQRLHPSCRPAWGLWTNYLTSHQHFECLSMSVPIKTHPAKLSCAKVRPSWLLLNIRCRFLMKNMTGWWFGTWLLFPHSVGNFIISIDELIFFPEG